MTEVSLPDGFTPHYRKSPLTDPWEPIYSCVDDESVRLGMFIREPHCNGRGVLHGGLIAALSDNAMGHSCGEVIKNSGREIAGLVTISMTNDFVGSAKLGQWMEIVPRVVKAGGSIAFVECLVLADGEVISRGSASFKILS
ncbi:MAG: thioesterase [Ponticaulis sp.]|nr:thioesterase [Ponticaulis sp.]|tara:strand:- start:54776 stop:55198 length:423 start_codon:yes stop_codon:yes gene_type:complete